jgi:type III secretory pathway component EscU
MPTCPVAYPANMKPMIRRKLERRKTHVVRTTRKFVADRDLRNEVEADTLKGYSENHRLIKIRYPQGANPMPVPTRRELNERIKELESENEDLQTQIDDIAEIVTPEEDDNEGEE